MNFGKNLSMMNEARKLKQKLDKAKKELEQMQFEVEAGKGQIKIVIDGEQKIRSIKIDPEIINPDPKKVDYMEKLIQKAVNDAVNQSQKAAAKHLESLTAGLKIPGLTG